MTPDEKALLLEAIETLIHDTDSAQLFRQLTGVYDLAKRDVPVRLVGRPAVLNALLDLWLKDEPAAERVVDLINKKRAELGREPVGDADYNRRGYMRELMAQKRERGRRLVELANGLRAEKDKLRGTTRMDFERMHANRWYEVKKERENDLRESVGRRLTVDEMNAVASQLWADVDSELDAFEAFVQAEIRKPIHQRAPAGFDFKLKPKKG